MTSEHSAPTGLRVVALVAIDAIAYALVVTALATVGALLAGIATGGGLVRGNALLFVAGLALMAYATFRLWPSSPEDFRNEGEPGVPPGRAGPSLPATATETRFQAVVRALPPVRWLRPPPPERQLSPAAKLFLGSVAVLLTSFLLETAFGVV